MANELVKITTHSETDDTGTDNKFIGTEEIAEIKNITAGDLKNLLSSVPDNYTVMGEFVDTSSEIYYTEYDTQYPERDVVYINTTAEFTVVVNHKYACLYIYKFADSVKPSMIDGVNGYHKQLLKAYQTMCNKHKTMCGLCIAMALLAVIFFLTLLLVRMKFTIMA